MTDRRWRLFVLVGLALALQLSHLQSAFAMNDSCATATAITNVSFSKTVALTTANGYTDGFPHPSCGSGGINAVYSLGPPVTYDGAQFHVDTSGSNFQVMRSVWRGSCASLAEVACNTDFTSPYNNLAFTVNGTSTYYIVCEGITSAEGSLSITVNTGVGQPPVSTANDICTRAKEITNFKNPTNGTWSTTVALLAYDQVNNQNGYTDGWPSPPCGTGGINAVWSIEPPFAAGGRRFTVDTSGSNIGTMVSVWRGTCTSNVCVGCGSSALNGGGSVTFETDGISSYYIVGEGNTGQEGSLSFSLSSP